MLMQDKPLEREQLLDQREWAIKKPIGLADAPSNIIVTVYLVPHSAFPEGAPLMEIWISEMHMKCLNKIS